MLKVYVAAATKKQVDLINANPYVVSVRGKDLYLQEIDKENANGLVFYMLDELTPEEIYFFKDYITAIGVNDIIKLRKRDLTK